MTTGAVKRALTGKAVKDPKTPGWIFSVEVGFFLDEGRKNRIIAVSGGYPVRGITLGGGVLFFG